MNSCDLYLDQLSQLVTTRGFSQKPACGEEQGKLEVIEDAAVAISEGRIVAVGPREELLRAGWAQNARKSLNGQGLVALPGFIDPHTHLVFAGSREEEFLARLQGEDYLEILQQGGGILNTVRSTRQASFFELLQLAESWVNYLLQMGTTTCEVKSGYGLDRETEIKQLKVVKELAQKTPLDLIPTYLGAHAWPPEYQDNHQAYLQLILEQVLPEIVQENLAEFCDVFCEKGVFSRKESALILQQARDLGLGIKIHADELSNLGGAELAAQLGAISADHLVAVSAKGIEEMARAGVIAILLPGTTFALNKEKYAPARQMIKVGVPVALATDFNPGSSPILSMPLIISLACMKLGLTVEEAITAATINAAHALNRGHELGSLEEGKIADLILLDLDNYRQLPYYLGTNLVKTVIKRGQIIKEMIK